MRYVLSIFLISILSAAQTSEEVACVYQLAVRYAPFVDDLDVHCLENTSKHSHETWWLRSEDLPLPSEDPQKPLKGLHIAIDPGHIGGAWAHWEGREFRMRSEDYWIREGELVLEVAKLCRSQLEKLGGQVSLVRSRNEPVNTEIWSRYFASAIQELTLSNDPITEDWLRYLKEVGARMMRTKFVIDEILERARVINQEIRPDLVLSLHMNAAPWSTKHRLYQANHFHALIFGCVTKEEITITRHREQMFRKLHNGSGAVEEKVGLELTKAMAHLNGLPASQYGTDNVINIGEGDGYLFARNLLMLRMVECPIILLEPYIMNSEEGYVRLQEAIDIRQKGGTIPKDDILIEYADGVVAGILNAYTEKTN